MTLLIMLSTSVFADGCVFLVREENYVKAFPLCKQEAEQGDARAQYKSCDKGSKDGFDNYKKM